MSYTLAIGPFAPSWPGPQRLVLTVDGEKITDVTYREGIDDPDFNDRLPRWSIEQVMQQVVSISPTSAHAHTMAFCQAIETLATITIPERAAYMRCVAAELERVLAHVTVVCAIFNLLGLQRTLAVLQDIRARIREALLLYTGTSGPINLCIPGGMRHDIDDTQRDMLIKMLDLINHDLFELIDLTIDETRLLARTIDVGSLTTSVTEQYGLSGPVARAAGLEMDARLDQPYAAYARLLVRRVIQEGGDVHARLVVMMLESFESLKLVEQALHELPAGPLQEPIPDALPAGDAEAVVEAPRGLLRYHLSSDGFRLTSLTIEPPRRIDRLLARTLFVGTLIDNVVLIALSTDPRIDDIENQAKP